MPFARTTSNAENARWMRELLQFAMQTTKISCSTFYWIDDQQRLAFAASDGVDAAQLRLYQAKFQGFDPCRPERLIAAQTQVQTLVQASMTLKEDELARYWPYMRLSGIKDAMDLLFWHDGRPIGGLGMIAKGEDAVFGSETVLLAQGLRHYVEASLAFHPQVVLESARLRLKTRYGLTRREVKVAELIGQGLTNQEIAEEMSIAQPTVKTHVQSIFRKMDVTNRTSLIAAI